MSIQKGFRFKEDIYKKFNEVKMFFGGDEKTDTFILGMIIRSYYEDIYIPESNKYFFKQIENVFMLIEEYQGKHIANIYKNIFETIIQELEVLCHISKQSNKKIYSEFVKFLREEIGGTRNEPDYQELYKREAFDYASNNAIKRLNKVLEIHSIDIENAKKFIELVDQYVEHDKKKMQIVFKHDYEEGKLEFLNCHAV